MTLLIILISTVLITILILQIGRISELTKQVRGDEDYEVESNYWNSRLGFVFMIGFLVLTIATAIHYKNWMLGYGPHQSASLHGGDLDWIFNITLIITGIVFILTHIFLFYFAYKYRGVPGKKAKFLAHNNTLEIAWTVIPAIALTILVVTGLNAWNTAMGDVEEGEDYIEFEATGMQFAWLLRYPGPDGRLGVKDFRRISPLNPLGQVWEDEANLDDIHVNEIVLPVGKKVRVRITARDVLHNFYLPHFRVKMDAVPGMPTYFVFTPTKTTKEYRRELSEYEEYQVLTDPDDLESGMLWENFNYELACAELCGKGHFSMRTLVRVVTEEEYEEWLNNKSSYYENNIKDTELDIGRSLSEILPIDSLSLVGSLTSEFVSRGDKISLTNVFFNDDGELVTDSYNELDNLAQMLSVNDNVIISVSVTNSKPEEERSAEEINRVKAEIIMNYLISKGVFQKQVNLGSVSGDHEEQLALTVDTLETETGEALLPEDERFGGDTEKQEDIIITILKI